MCLPVSQSLRSTDWAVRANSCIKRCAWQRTAPCRPTESRRLVRRQRTRTNKKDKQKKETKGNRTTTPEETEEDVEWSDVDVEEEEWSDVFAEELWKATRKASTRSSGRTGARNSTKRKQNESSVERSGTVMAAISPSKSNRRKTSTERSELDDDKENADQMEVD